MLPQDFDLYGCSFRWLESDAVNPAKPFISLLRSYQPLAPDSVEWMQRGAGLAVGKSSAGFFYRFDNVGEFLVPPDGCLVRAFLNAEAAPWAVDFALSRGVIPRLLHLRGATCLHAGAVAAGGKAVVFCGPSGSGKSTLTAALAARGYPVITDDVLPLRAGSAAHVVMAGPGLADLRVHPATAHKLGIAECATAPCDGQTKAVWRPGSVAAAALPLAAIYLLEPNTPAASGASATPVQPTAALLSLLRNSFWLDPAETGALATDLVRFSQVVRSVPVARLSFVLSHQGFDAVERVITGGAGWR